MLTKLSIVAALAAALALGAGQATAASNPSGTGQPGTPTVNCGSGNATAEPNGFSTDGFAKAETKYAGSTNTPSANNAQSTHAVAQYDIACFQQTSNH